MLRTRLLVGSVLAAAAGGLVWFDIAPYFPGLFALTLALGLLATRELLALLPADVRPQTPMAVGGVSAVLAANWLPHLAPGFAEPVLTAFVAVVLAALAVELATYRGPGPNTARVAYSLLTVAYLGLLPSFLIRLRWLPGETALVALALTIFVPKCGDIGAYFTGRLLGRHSFAPRLSPKKTWEGFAGGMVTAAGTAVGLSYAAPLFRYGAVEAAAFGLAVGYAGVLGDLAESMVKRDARVKDASGSVPGFGGVLDVIDSVLFAAPVAYWWLTR